MSGKENVVMSIHDLMKLLPHRYPFLLIDRLIKLEPGKVAIALKNVTFNEPYFSGHFPEKPVMPGVLQIEAMAQTAAALMCPVPDPNATEKYIFLFTAIDQARFKRVVEPGDQLLIEVEFLRSKAGIYKFKATATVDGEVASEAELMCTKRPMV